MTIVVIVQMTNWNQYIYCLVD